ncbi:hypothetical protein LFL97_32140 [Burkholderia sp. JSH-S8]|nr:hypothetical protein LFL97_32140 [Burkholderia sp. JSH-S8]
MLQLIDTMTTEAVLREVFDEDRAVKDAFVAQLGAELIELSEALAACFCLLHAFNKATNRAETMRTALVAAFVFGVLDDNLTRYRQKLETSDPRTKGHHALKQLAWNAATLGVNADAVRRLKAAKQHCNGFSHAGLLAIVRRVALEDPGTGQFSGYFYLAKIDRYRAELRRLGLCRILPAFIRGVRVAITLSSARPLSPWTATDLARYAHTPTRNLLVIEVHRVLASVRRKRAIRTVAEGVDGRGYSVQWSR